MKVQNPLINHENEWVALTSDRKNVVASSKNLKILHAKLRKMGRDDIILHFVPPFTYISPSGRL